MHCSDEELLAHLDGELPFAKRARVRRHLEACWQCRTHAGSLEKQIQMLAKEAEDWDFPKTRWLAGQRFELDRRIRESEEESPWNHTSPGSLRNRVLVWSFAASLAGTIAIALFWPSKNQQIAVVGETLARTTGAERSLATRAVEQDFAVRFTQIAPTRIDRDSRLQVWSDGSTGRFASKWVGAEGTIKQSLWQPSAESKFVYDSSIPRSAHRKTDRGGTDRAVVSLASLADHGLEAGELERGFMRWMENRAWRPVAFTPELSLWIEKDGAVAKAERIQEAGGTLVRITSRKHARGIVAILTVDIDSQTWLPRRQTIRFELGERAVEFRITAQRLRTLALSELTPALFQPNVPVDADNPVVANTRLHDEIPASAKVEAITPVQSAIQLAEAQYVLHEAGACLGKPVRIEEEDGGVRVWDLVEDSGSSPEGFRGETTILDVTSALADLRKDLPLPTLEDDSVSVAAFRHAWALRNLALDFSPNRTAQLTAKSWHLVQLMLLSHISALRREIGALPIRRGTRVTREPIAGDWRNPAEHVFDLLLRVGQEPDSRHGFSEDLGARLDEIAIAFALESVQHRPENSPSDREF